MHFLVINRTRAGLTSEQYEKLAELARDFYTSPPEGIRLHGDWAAVDGSCTYAVIEAESRARLEALQAPFRPFVEMENVEVRPLTGWGG